MLWPLLITFLLIGIALVVWTLQHRQHTIILKSDAVTLPLRRMVGVYHAAVTVNGVKAWGVIDTASPNLLIGSADCIRCKLGPGGVSSLSGGGQDFTVRFGTQKDTTGWETARVCLLGGGSPVRNAKLKMGSVVKRSGESNMNVIGMHYNSHHSIMRQLGVSRFSVHLRGSSGTLMLSPPPVSDLSNAALMTSSPGSTVDYCSILTSMTVGGVPLTLPSSNTITLVCWDTGSNIISFPVGMMGINVSGVVAVTLRGRSSNSVTFTLSSISKHDIVFHRERADSNLIIIGTPALQGANMMFDIPQSAIVVRGKRCSHGFVLRVR